MSCRWSVEMKEIRDLIKYLLELYALSILVAEAEVLETTLLIYV